MEVGTELVPRLPSQDAAIHVAQGVDGGWVEAAGSTAFRAMLISAGLYAAGLRGKQLVKGAAFGALAIEVFVLGYTCYHVNKADD
jgi:hypothetical protein